MERFKLISAMHLFLIQDGKILLLRRANTGYEDGNYSVPSGHLEGGESVTTAMAREALEEACIVIDPKDLEVVHVTHRAKTDVERIDFFLKPTRWQGDIKNGEPDKCDDLSWFPLDNLPPNVIPYVRSALEQHLNNQTFSEFGWEK